MDKNLLRYGRDQAKKGASAESLRFKLLQAGWSDAKIDEVIKEVYTVDSVRRKVFFSIVVLFVVLFIGVMVYAFVLPNSGLQTPPNIKLQQPPKTNINPTPAVQSCASMNSDLAKDSCYQKEVDAGFDCTTLTSETEKAFCYRALDNKLTS